MLKQVSCTVMRGGTSKGLYFLASDLPADVEERDQILLAVMGSPDIRQIDGMGGAHPLTSKVAIVAPSSREDADVDYLFQQVSVDRAEVSGNQNCGNILAGVGPFAIEQGLVSVDGDMTSVRIHMVNSGALAIARVQTPDGIVEYEGETEIDGVPGAAAPISLEFLDIAGSNCGALLPTGNITDSVQGVEVSCIDNGMPVVLIAAASLGKTGYESPQELEEDGNLKSTLESIRLALGPMMNLDDVSSKTVPKMTLLAPARNGGSICTRSFIPHRAHEAIGVLAAVSTATGLMLPGSVAHQVAGGDVSLNSGELIVEHPTGFFTVELEANAEGEEFELKRSALLRTARKLMSGNIFYSHAMRRV